MSRSITRLVFAAFTAAMLVVYGVAAWLSPLQGDDWTQWMWSARRADDSPRAWLATHFTFADIVHYVLAHATWFHAIVTPLVCLALVLGVYTLAMRRLPRLDAWEDVLGVVLVSALLWITQPRPGYVLLFHRPSVAWQVYGCALAVWTIAPFRCGWRPRGATTVLLAVAAFLVGTTTRQIATATLVGLAVIVLGTPRTARARWMWLALGLLLAGTIVGYISAPHIEIPKVFKRGLETNLQLLVGPLGECGQLITLGLLLVLAKLVIELKWPSEPAELPDPRATHRWLWTWFAISVFALFGPRSSDATLLPANLALCAAAVPWMRWLASSRILRRVLVAFAVGVHVIAWSAGLATFARLGGEYRERMAILDRAAPGSVAVIPPYSDVLPTPWFFGEDWFATTRQLVAIEVFGLQDIDFQPWFRKLDANPRLAIRLEVEGATPAQIADAAPPLWATELSNARTQFEAFVKGLEQTAGTTFTARLVVDDLAFPERGTRPLYAAWYEGGKLTAPRTTRSSFDANDRLTVRMPPALARQLPDSYLVRDGAASPIPGPDGNYRLQPLVAGRYAIVACAPQRCLAIDALVPRF